MRRLCPLIDDRRVDTLWKLAVRWPNTRRPDCPRLLTGWPDASRR
jgi:hypothetical protein